MAPNDLVGALDAFGEALERTIDVGYVNGRPFLNDVSLGIYGMRLKQAGYRDAKVRTLLETTATEVLGPASVRPDLQIVDGYLISGNKRWIGLGSVGRRRRGLGTRHDRLPGGANSFADAADVCTGAPAVRQATRELPDGPGALVNMLVEVTAMQLYCLRLGRLIEEARMSDTIAALAKLNNTVKARQVIAEARNLLGGHGLLLEYHVIRHMTDIEAIYTYEGTEAMQTTLVGRHITGVAAFA